jgi:hypothetical protein
MKRTLFGLIGLLLMLGLTEYCFAQKASPLPTEVLTWVEGTPTPKATLDIVRWLEGSWQGQLEGSMQEHTVFAPVSGQMPGFVRAWRADGSIWFYEISLFVQVGETLEIRVKHFSPELAGWEGKDEYVRRPLIAFTDKALFFDGITYAKNGPNNHTVYFRIPEGDHKGEIIVVHQKRVK